MSVVALPVQNSGMVSIRAGDADIEVRGVDIANDNKNTDPRRFL